MKERLMGVINYVFGIVAGISVIVFALCPLVSVASHTTSPATMIKYNGFQLLNANFSFINNVSVGREIALAGGIFTIIAVLLALMLIVASVMMILKKSEVYDWKLDNKISDFSMFFNAFSSFMAVMAFGVYLCSVFFKNANSELPNIKMSTTVCGILLFAIPTVLSMVMWIVDTIKETKAAKEAKALEEPKAE